MADTFDVSVQQFDRTYRRYAAPEAIKEIDGKLFFHSRSILDAWAQSQKQEIPDGVSPDDLLLTGENSPALEEFRRGRAKMIWMDVAEREKTLIPRGQIEPPLTQAALVLRRAGERLARSYGNDAAAVLNEAVDQWESTCEALLDEPDAAVTEAGGADDPHATAADDARVR